jgi:D-alanine-D-alanine ligase-like ATP-grasp enzyme
VVYGPLYLYWLWLCLKARSFFFFNASNPSITNGGFLMESKKQIYDLLPWQYYPNTMFVKAQTPLKEILVEIRRKNFSFPLIAKPDIGMKGLSVKKLCSKDELFEYAIQSRVDFLVQEFISFDNEVGIFYHRFPNEERGHISGIVRKEFLTVVGDGESTMTELLRKDKRFILQLSVLKETYGDELKRILQKGEEKILVPYGNHARGAKFIDASNLIDEELTNTIDSICRRVKGFYFGRLDIRFNSWDELRSGKNFSIIEINGAGSEPTHMYDSNHSIFFAWKEIIRHWNILWKVSSINHRRYKLPYLTTSSGLEMLRQNKCYVKMISENVRQRA